MAKRSDVTLLLPPRYPRNDPRNQARVNAGHLLSMQMGGYDYPIRKLRRVGDINCVTLPLQVRDSLALERGDWLLFTEGSWPGLAVFFKVDEDWCQVFTDDERKEVDKLTRKVQAQKAALFVNIPPRICEILSAEVGDNLIFGLALSRHMVTVAAIKGADDSAGCRRPG